MPGNLKLQVLDEFFIVGVVALQCCATEWISYTHTRTHTYRHIHTHTHTCTHTDTHTYTQRHTQTHTHTHRHTHIQTHAHIHTHAHTHIPSFLDFLPIYVNTALSRVPWARQRVLVIYLFYTQCHPESSAGKESTWDSGDPGSIPRSGRSTGEGIGYPLQYSWASLVAQLVTNPSAMRETWVGSLGWEDPLERGKAAHSCILAWRIPWTV